MFNRLIIIFIISVLTNSCCRTWGHHNPFLCLIPNRDAKIGFLDALNREDTDQIEIFISKTIDINTRIEGFYPLIYAVEHNKLQAMLILLKNGADPNVSEDLTGQTPLFSVKSMEALQILLQYGADVSQQDFTGRTPRDVIQRLSGSKYHSH